MADIKSYSNDFNGVAKVINSKSKIAVTKGRTINRRPMTCRVIQKQEVSLIIGGPNFSGVGTGIPAIYCCCIMNAGLLAGPGPKGDRVE